MGILSGRSILVVEDEMLVLMSIEAMLEELGCSEIAATATCAGALALLQRRTFDAAMLDVNLGSENSYPIADALIAAGVPFVFSTGYGDHGDRTDLATRPVLRKPYGLAALEEQLGRLMPIEDWPKAA